MTRRSASPAECGQKPTLTLVPQFLCEDATMSLPEQFPAERAEAIPALAIRPRPERAERLARMARPKLVARANEFFETCDGANASFNAFTETHGRFVLAIHPTDREHKTFGISFVACLYLAGPTFWNNAQLRCRSLDDPNSGLLYEVADEAARFVVRCDSIVVPTLDLTFAYEWSLDLAA